MATIRHPLVIRRAAILALLLAGGPALAQESAGTRAGRSLTATGQTKPPGAPGTAAAPLPKPASTSEMAKAQKAAEARSKAWDARTKRSMTSICNGC